MRDADQVNKGIRRPNQLAIAVGVKRIARDNFTFGRQLSIRARTHQNPRPMSALQKNRQQRAANISRSTRYKYAPGIG